MTEKVELELGKTAVFTLESGEEKTIVIYSQDENGLLDIEVNGICSSFSSLHDAIGVYVQYRYV